MTEQAQAFGDVDQLDSMQSQAANDETVNNAPPPSEWPYDQVIAENATMMAGMGFHVMANKYGPHWNLREVDGQRLGVALAQCADHYMKWFERMGPGGNLALIAATLIGPRMVKGAIVKAQKKTAEVNREAANDE